MDPEKLLNEINKGKGISREILDEIAELLSGEKGNNLSADDVYSYVSILGVADAKNYKHILEKYLDYRDPLTVVKVLNILCDNWNYTDEYLERIIAFALGVPWDEEEDLRQAAIYILGEFLHKSYKGETFEEQHKQVIKLLLDVFEDKKSDIFCRISSYRALCRAAQSPWEKVPAECVIINVEEMSKDVDWKMIKELKGLVK